MTPAEEEPCSLTPDPTIAPGMQKGSVKQRGAFTFQQSDTLCPSDPKLPSDLKMNSKYSKNIFPKKGK